MSDAPAEVTRTIRQSFESGCIVASITVTDGCGRGECVDDFILAALGTLVYQTVIPTANMLARNSQEPLGPVCIEPYHLEIPELGLSLVATLSSTVIGSAAINAALQALSMLEETIQTNRLLQEIRISGGNPLSAVMANTPRRRRFWDPRRGTRI